jgi:hypothetical protein
MAAKPGAKAMTHQPIRQESANRQYVTLSAAFEFFNRRLFASWLPAAQVSLHHRPGAHWAGRFEGCGVGKRGEDLIVLNTATFRDRSDAEILSMLVHEMAHQFQAWYGTPGCGGYHNREWANLMKGAGLMPSASARGGGGSCPITSSSAGAST